MLHRLQWRYATKEFDPTKELDEDIITELLKAMNMTASSYGLQPYEFVVVKDKGLQEKLSEASYGQRQPADASHVIVIAAKTEITNEYIDAFIENISQTRSQGVEELQEYAQRMKDSIGGLVREKQLVWAQKQCYITLGTLLIAAADLKIDACPMEGFDPAAFDEILGLEKEGLHATLVVPVGYRSVNDSYQHLKKVRWNLGDIVRLKYR